MTNREINEAIYKRRGYKQVQGNMDNLTSIVYFFLLDASKQVFDKGVRKQPCKGLQKKYMNQMKEAYHAFFSNFFSAFNQEQTDYIIDKADEFEEFIQHHLDIAEIALQECDNSLPIETQRELSQTWLCNLLANDAQDFHGECWKTASGQPLYDPYIDRVLKASKEYSRLRFGEGRTLTQKQFDRVQAAVKVVANKMCTWLYEDYKREINGTTKKNGTVAHAEDARAGGRPATDDAQCVRVRPEREDTAEAGRDRTGDGRLCVAVGGIDHDASGSLARQEPLDHRVLLPTYGHFPVIPRVRSGKGNLE